jgi:benzodiazapine receptor
MQINTSRWKHILVACLAAFGVAAIGGALTDIGPWYQALKQPAWKPPDAAFGPVWTTLFALCATSAVIGWERAPSAAARRSMTWAFVMNAALNVLWSLLFFKLRRPDLAAFEVVLLWVSIVLLIVLLRRWSTAAAWLLAPYLGWVTLATAINWSVVRHNGPFV